MNFLYKASGWTAALFILAICILVMAQVTLNLIDKVYGALFGVPFGLTIPSYADFTGFFLAASSFLALAYTLREGGHIRVSLLLHQFSHRVQHFFEILCLSIAAAITLYFTWFTGRLVLESWTYGDLSAGMIAVPIWIPQASILVGLAILAIAVLDELISVLLGHGASYEGKGENLLVDEDDTAADYIAGEDRP
ncbi:TRAP transporter small permease [Sneathiella chinensis]|uniref:TRAP transporter small permease protein n=1 Tax=Sneathiella chinensis TaxID=349750 RepID=A0ABQ5U5D0_9PROT|nr:TRAP transporter small permease [Sneathiella chinensis]GLQ06890.1 C4-dicarboxylate ABC transporter substrate-binding protein [Sneathiella chinensis]